VKALKTFGIGLGSVLSVLALILDALLPEGRGWVALSILAFGLLLLLAGLVLNRDRVIATLRGRRTRAAGASLGYVLTVVAVIALVNFLSHRHHARLDLTENKQFSLSEQTIKILQALPREVTITAFFQDVAPARGKLKDLLDEYGSRSQRLKYDFVDPDTHPAEAKRYGITEYGTVVVESGKQESRVNAPDEESLTNALIKVTRDRERVVYVTTGHGERDLKDGGRNGLSVLQAALEKQHYTVRPLILNQGVPADAGVVVIAGPQKAFLEAEAKMIRDHLEKGGRVFYMQDPETDPGLHDVLAAYGVTVRKDVVVDRISQLFAGNALMPMVSADGYDEFHPVTKTFKYQTFYPLASSIAIADKPPEGVTATKLAQTSAASWGETNEQELKSGRITLDAGVDTKGPLTIGAAVVRSKPGASAEKKDPEKPGDETRLLVFGDSDFLTNASFNAAGNGDLALNGIAWLSEQEELVSIRPKTSMPRVVILTRQQVLTYLITIVAFPLIGTVAIGTGIWLRRKKL